MQNAEKNALEWFASNKLLCNQSKTQHITLSLMPNTENKSVKLLGFLIDAKLGWGMHVDGICKKLSRVIYLFWKLRDLVSIDFLKTAYFGLFYSHLTYGILLWGHCPAVADILILQKKVIRIMCRVDPMEHCKPLFVQLNMLTVVNLYILQVLLYTKQNQHKFFTRNSIHSHNTRGKDFLDLPHHRLAKSGNSYQINSIKFFNRLPVTAHLTPFKKFKNKITDYLLKNPFYSITEYMEANIDINF